MSDIRTGQKKTKKSPKDWYRPTLPEGQDEDHDGWPEHLYKRGKTYWWRGHVLGAPYQFSLKVKDLRNAKSMADDYNDQVRKGVDFRAEHETRRLQFSSIRQQHLDQLKAEDKVAAVKRYRAIYDNFQAFLDCEHPGTGVAGITATIAKAYPVWRRVESEQNKKPGSHKTLQTEVTALRSLFQRQVEDEVLARNPFIAVKLSGRKGKGKNQDRFRLLEDGEIEAVLEAARTYDEWANTRHEPVGLLYYQVYRFVLGTGLRDDELRHLMWSDVDGDTMHIKEKVVVERRVVHLSPRGLQLVKERARKAASPNGLLFPGHPGKQAAALRIKEPDVLMTLTAADFDEANRTLHCTHRYTWTPKSTEGSVFLNADTRALLEGRRGREGRGRSGFVFEAEDGGRLRCDLLRPLKKCAAHAGLRESQRLRFHDLRHSFAGLLRRARVPLETIMGLMRHQDIRETLIYAPYQPDEGRTAVARLVPPVSENHSPDALPPTS